MTSEKNNPLGVTSINNPHAKPELEPVTTGFLILTPLLALTLVPWYMTHGFELAPWLIFVVMYLLTGFSITAGYHRLFSHKTFEAHPIVRLIFLIFGAGTFQNSALKWCTDHRLHHRYVDHSKDPYNAKRGFFYSHIGWVFYKSTYFRPEVWGKDLMKDPLVLWQHRNYYWLAIAVGFGLPTLVGAFFGSALGGFLVGGLLRVVFVHHATFCINSLAHIWGRSTYSEEHTAKDNFFLAFLTYGEGYHNFHHQFANDYRNGIRWYQFDPTKWLIQALHFFGLAHGLKRTPKHEILLAKMRQKEAKVFEEGAVHAWARESLKSFQDAVEQAGVKLHEMREKRDQIRLENRETVLRWKTEIRRAKREMEFNYRMWKATLRAQKQMLST